MKLIIDVDEKLVCEGFERTLTEEERDILIRAIGNGVKYVEPKIGIQIGRRQTMKFYSKSVIPKEIDEENSEMVKSIKEDIAQRIGSAIADYMVFEESDDCIHYPELQDKHGWVREYIGSVDVSIPTKLMPIGSSGNTYVCQNCFSNNNIPRTYWFSDRVPKYCEHCGAHFTNIVKDSELPVYFIKRKEVDDGKAD